MHSNNTPWPKLTSKIIPNVETMIQVIVDPYCWWFRNPATVEVGSLSRYLQGFIHPRWLLGISEPSTVWLIPDFIPSTSAPIFDLQKKTQRASPRSGREVVHQATSKVTTSVTTSTEINEGNAQGTMKCWFVHSKKTTTTTTTTTTSSESLQDTYKRKSANPKVSLKKPWFDVLFHMNGTCAMAEILLPQWIADEAAPKTARKTHSILK